MYVIFELCKHWNEYHHTLECVRNIPYLIFLELNYNFYYSVMAEILSESILSVPPSSHHLGPGCGQDIAGCTFNLPQPFRPLLRAHGSLAIAVPPQ